MPIAEMPELGQISGEQAAALTGLAPLHMAEARCAVSALLATDGGCYGMPCSRLLLSQDITIQS